MRGDRRTLCAAVTPQAAVFRIAPDRHEREAAALLGDDFKRIVGSDRWWAYRGFDPDRRQVCWSHLIRDFTAHAEGLPRSALTRPAWRSPGDRRRLRREVAPLKRELKALLEHGSKGRPNKLTWGASKPAQGLPGALDLH